jgi:hypothetical protein
MNFCRDNCRLACEAHPERETLGVKHNIYLAIAFTGVIALIFIALELVIQ